jgi:hypothetical protein
MGLINHNYKHSSDPDANVMCEFSGEFDPSSAYTSPTADATWTKLTSNTSASVLAALEDCGYQRWQFSPSGTDAIYRVPQFLET